MKFSSLSTPVLTPTGWTTMGELRPGDQVVGSDGCAAKVTHIHPQDAMPIYRITMSDGMSTTCGKEHLWLIRTHNDLRVRKPGRVVGTGAVIELLRDGRDRDTYIPIVDPVQFAPQAPLPLNPYGLGVLIRSASLRTTPRVGSIDLLDNLRAALPHFTMKISGTGAIYLGSNGTRTNPLTAILRELGLWDTRTWERRIPPQYFTAPVRDRLGLLQGLMDGSGWVQLDKLGKTSAFTSTVGEDLKDDIVELVESLGGTARIWLRAEPRYRRGVGQPNSWIMVRLPNHMVPFRVAAKAQRWQSGRPSKDMSPQRKIVAVDYVGDGQTQRITVDREDGLYVTEHYILTHNSSSTDAQLSSGEDEP